MNALDFITATVEPDSDAASRFLDLAKACPRPNPSEHVRVGGIVRGEIDHTGWHLRFEWTHETGPHGEPWQDKPRAEIYVEKVLGAVRDRWATIGLRNNQVWISRPDVANSVFQPARSLQGLFAGIAAVPVHRTGDLVHADIRAVLTAWAPRLIAAAEAQVTATVEPGAGAVSRQWLQDVVDAYVSQCLQFGLDSDADDGETTYADNGVEPDEAKAMDPAGYHKCEAALRTWLAKHGSALHKLIPDPETAGNALRNDVGQSDRQSDLVFHAREAGNPAPGLKLFAAMRTYKWFITCGTRTRRLVFMDAKWAH